MKRKLEFVDIKQTSPKRQKINGGSRQKPSIVYRKSVTPGKKVSSPIASAQSSLTSQDSSSRLEDDIESSPLSKKTPPAKTPLFRTPTKSKIPQEAEIPHPPHRWKTPEKSLIRTAKRIDAQDRNVYFSDPQLHATYSRQDYDRSPSMDSLVKYKKGIIKKKDWHRLNMKARNIGNSNTIDEKRSNRRNGKLSPNTQIERFLEDSRELRSGGYVENLWSHMRNVIDFLNPYKSIE
eukprot:NODE_188_length_15619_cov_0.374871.p5 type:complete len:235 gc:universal NODE_188_length_15619_cov_0.374871:2206-2910(+)